MNRNKLDKAIERILFEDMSFGLHSKVSTIHDRPVTSGEPDHNFKPNLASTMQSSVPLRPSELMATQLADERPPIEDLEYSPVSVPALKAAVSALADLVPPDQVTRFYRRAQELLDDVTERQAEGEIAKSAEVEEELKLANDKEEEDVMSKNTKNESRRNRLDTLINLLKEAVGPSDADLSSIERDPEAFISSASAKSNDSLEDLETKLRSSPAQVTDDEILQDVANYLNFNSPSGAKQYIQRLLDRVRYEAMKVGSKKMDPLKLKAATKYASALIDMGDERLADMTPRQIVNSDDAEFRFFLGSLVGDAYSELKKGPLLNLKTAISEISQIPAEIRDTVFNQVTGGAARKDSTIRSRLAGKYTETEIENAVTAVRESYESLKSIMNRVTGDLTLKASEILNNSKEMKRRIVDAQTEAERFDDEIIVDELIGETLEALRDNIVSTLRKGSPVNASEINSVIASIKETDEFNLMMTDPKYGKTKSLYDAIVSVVSDLSLIDKSDLTDVKVRELLSMLGY